MEELLKTFTVPDHTTMEEHSIVVKGGAIVGNHSEMGFGVIADSVIAGERVKIAGNVTGTDEVRIDMWSHVGGNVKTNHDAYIGEFVTIDGKLIVEGNLDIGKNVKIKGGFKARGWIVVRNSIPVVIYIFLYLTELLRLGKNEEVEKVLEDLFSDEGEDLNEDKLLIIPSGSKIDLESIKVPDRAVIGSGCRMMGNIRAAFLTMKNDNTLFGSIKTADGIVIGTGNIIHGDLVTKGEVRVYGGTHILGEINGGTIFIDEKAKVDGAMRAPGGVIIAEDAGEEKTKADLFDLIPEPFLKRGKKPARQTTTYTKAPGKTAPIESAAYPEPHNGVTEENSPKPEPDIPKKRLITAIRLSDIEESEKKKKKTALKTETKTTKKPYTKKTGTKKTSTGKKTHARKTDTKKTSTKTTTKKSVQE